MTIYCFFISLFALCFGALYIGGVWNPGKKLVGLNYVVVNDDKGCYTSLCEKIGLNNTRNVGNYYARLDGTGGRFTVVVNIIYIYILNSILYTYIFILY